MFKIISQLILFYIKKEYSEAIYRRDRTIQLNVNIFRKLIGILTEQIKIYAKIM